MTTNETNEIFKYAFKREYPIGDTLGENDFEYKIKFSGKKSIVIGNPEGLNINNIIKSSYDTKIDENKDNIILLGNIIGSTFSKNPFLTKDFGEDDPGKLKTYYRNIIDKKSYNDANIKFCLKDNVSFIMGNRELDLIKIKDLVELETGSYGEGTVNEYVTNRTQTKFKISDISGFYPFWVKYYFTDPYKIPPEFRFIRRFKKLFKSIDAEMLLFTLFYEKYRNDELLEDLTLLANSYFYGMVAVTQKTNYDEKLDILDGDDEIAKFRKLPDILDRLDYLAYYVFRYFETELSSDGKLYMLLNKADFILQLKVADSYYLFSHGGITESMFNKTSSTDIPISIFEINKFIKENKDILTDITKIKKSKEDIVKLHNESKKSQAIYYNKLIKQYTGTCNTTVEQEINFAQESISNQNVTTSYDYNLLLYHSLNRDIKQINEILTKPLTGGFVSQEKSKFKGFYNDIKKFTNESKEEINKYNDYLKKVVGELFDNGCVNDDKPTENLLLILMLAHSFNNEIFRNILDPKIKLRKEKFKSKNYSVLINTIYDHRSKHNVPFKNIHQIIANSNNTAQTTEAIYDAIFHGAIIDCYETEIVGRPHERNYIISIDNSAIIKHYSYFDSNTCLYIEPNLINIFNVNQIGINTLIQKIGVPNIIIFRSLENLYKILNHKIKKQMITLGTKIKESKTTSTGLGNLICQSMNYYGIDNNNEIIFSESEIKPIDFRKYKF